MEYAEEMQTLQNSSFDRKPFHVINWLMYHCLRIFRFQLYINTSLFYFDCVGLI